MSNSAYHGGNARLHPESALQAFAECLWVNQANLIDEASKHFRRSPALVATVLLPVLFQVIATAQPDKRTLKRLIGETIDKGFDDWLRTARTQGGVQ